MALDDILRAIREETDTEAERIESEAAAEVAAIEVAARSEAERLRGEILAARNRDAQAERDGVLRAARARAASAWRDGREEVFGRVHAEFMRRLNRLRADRRYPRILRALLDEAVAALPEAIEVRVDPRDLPLFDRAARPGSGRLGVEGSLETRGGVEVVAPGGRAVRNTVEERLARSEPFLRSLVAGVIPNMAPRREEVA